LHQKKVFLKLENHLLKQARVLYRMGFTPKNLSSSQMAAVGERIQTAQCLHDAQTKVSDFLEKQRQKLEAKALRAGKSDKPASWLIPAGRGNSGLSLGKTLIDWIEKERYLEGSAVSGEAESGEIDQLAALRRFWSDFHGHYCYQKACGESMPLEEEDKLS
jgi:hypothetical protein